ncbi:MAG: methyltransferase domain-containing protein [Ramlibacter sp.]|nr:methyltransferase domain-containing protein [Ramlibacter sp.]
MNAQDAKTTGQRPDPPDLAQVTLAHYEQHARAFWEGTRDHDVSQNIDALLRHIEAAPPFELLDLGCGPGRDLQAFRARGHHAVGLDGAPAFVAMAHEHSGCEVWQQNLFALDLPSARFDGIFANAVLFHLPGAVLPRVLAQLRLALRSRGVLFSSNPRGQGQEGWSGGRYGVYHSLAGWRRRMADAGFVELEHFYRPAGLPRQQQPWLASVWRVAPAPARPPTCP